jgi:hypothetical protein
MPQTPHIEHHFTAGEFVRDAGIGTSDGLTGPFALAAGLSGAVTQPRPQIPGRVSLSGDRLVPWMGASIRAAKPVSS